MTDAINYYDTSQRISLVHCSTTAGPISMKFIERWSPNGFDRALELFWRGYFDGSHFHFVRHDRLAAFGMSYTIEEDLLTFAEREIQDDPPMDPAIKFEEGIISFDGRGPNTRNHHMFVTLGSEPDFGTKPWEVPVGKVVEGIENLKNLYDGYGGNINLEEIRTKGEPYMKENFPKQDRLINCLASDLELDRSKPLEKVKEVEIFKMLKSAVDKWDGSKGRFEAHRDINIKSSYIYKSDVLEHGDLQLLSHMNVMMFFALVLLGIRVVSNKRRKRASTILPMIGRAKSY